MSALPRLEQRERLSVSRLADWTSTNWRDAQFDKSTDWRDGQDVIGEHTNCDKLADPRSSIFFRFGGDNFTTSAGNASRSDCVYVMQICNEI